MSGSNDYDYPGTWYIGKDGNRHRCRTHGGVPCKKHSAAGHITDTDGVPIIASTEEELEERIHAGTCIGLQAGAPKTQPFKSMSTYADIANKKPVSAYKPAPPKPGAAMFSSMKNNLIAKARREAAKSARAHHLSDALNHPPTEDEIIASRDAIKPLLQRENLWIYDNPAYKGTTSKSVEELADDYLNADNAINDSRDANIENSLTDASDEAFMYLTNAERFSVVDYTEVGYYNANRALNDGKPLDDRSAVLVSGVDKAMRTVKPLESDTVFYRYTDDNGIEDTVEPRNAEDMRYYRSLSAGDGIVRRESFVSTTMLPGSFMKENEGADNTAYIMIARRGVRGLSMVSQSRYQEHEFLIDRGYDTRVLAVYERGRQDDNGGWIGLHPVIIVEVLPKKDDQ